jgi:hypothetical protein
MFNVKVIAVCVAAGLAAVGGTIALVIRSRGAASDSPGQRLLAHARERSDYRICVGVPLNNPSSWAEVAHVTESACILRDGEEVKAADIRAYVIAYPSGALLDHRGPTRLPLPSWVGGLEPANVREQDKLTPADLKQGQAFVRVVFGRSTAQPASREHYSTTLTNVSDRRVRVLKFAGYSKSGSAYVLNTVTGRFFSPQEFREWYNQSGNWIEQGQSVTDPNNYGSPPVLWAYYIEAEGGGEYLTGGIIE